MTSPCVTCHQKCCQDHIVTITGYDAWLIAQRLELAPEQFMQVVPHEKPTEGGFYLDHSRNTFDIALDKVYGEADERRCIFWMSLPGETGRCGIYPSRPLVCQTYPAFLTNTGVHRREDVHCPQDAWRDGEVKRPIWRQRLYRMQVEYDIYWLAVARWNYHVLTARAGETFSAGDYYSFLLAYYAQLEPVRAAIGDDAWQAMCDVWGAASVTGRNPLETPVQGIEPWAGVVEEIYRVALSFFRTERALA